MRADQQTTTEVMETIKRFGDAFSKRDMDTIVSLLAPDPDVTFFGTGADEERVGLPEIEQQIQRDWAQSELASINWDRLSVSNQGPVAWVAGDVTFKAKAQGKEMTFPGRVTAVVDKRNGEWLFDQLHLSVPLAGQERGQSFPR